MLSRVAESLYWMSRYIERAEDLTRLLTVNFNALLDMPFTEEQPAWQPIVAITGDDLLFQEVFGQANARAVTEFLVWHPLNPNAVTACIVRARENARSVREQISSEMWEQINRLYFLVKDADRAAIQHSPHQFFQQVRDGSQAFQGITTATLTHGEAYEFIQLGKHLERADKTVRIVGVKYAAVHRLPEGSAEASLQLVAMLRSCSAFEPFRRTPDSQLTAARVAEFLLLSRDFPRAVLFCVNRNLRSLDTLDDTAGPSRPDGPRRVLGRLLADLQYLDIREVLGDDLDRFLNQLLERLNLAGREITRTYFNTQVILPDERPQQQQQQQ
jgi:uncharacterized alpha-E superfamily protein